MLSANLASDYGEVVINGFGLLTSPKQANAYIRQKWGIDLF